MYTYDSLTSAISLYAENTSDEFMANMPTFISNTVRNIARETDVIGLNTTATVVVSSANPEVALPDECLLIKTIAHVSGTSKTLLKRRPYDFIVSYWPDSAQTSTPLFYDRLNDSTVYLGPTPSVSSSLEVRYVTVSIPTSANQESYILTRYPEMCLYKGMVEASMFMKSTSDAQTWQQLYDRARESAENEARRNRRDDGATPIMGKMGQDTLKGSV